MRRSMTHEVNSVGKSYPSMIDKEEGKEEEIAF
jgi:hypothetical protein